MPISLAWRSRIESASIVFTALAFGWLAWSQAALPMLAGLLPVVARFARTPIATFAVVVAYGLGEQLAWMPGGVAAIEATSLGVAYELARVALVALAWALLHWCFGPSRAGRCAALAAAMALPLLSPAWQLGWAMPLLGAAS